MKNYYPCTCCDRTIEQDEIYYQFGGTMVCKKCLPDYLVRYAETADYENE